MLILDWIVGSLYFDTVQYHGLLFPLLSVENGFQFL